MCVGIIAANNIRYSPYIFFYTDILSKNNIEYELIYPDRNGLEENFDGVSCTLPWNSKCLRCLVTHFIQTPLSK